MPWHEAIRQQVSAATEVSDLSRRLLGEFVLFTTELRFVELRFAEHCRRLCCRVDNINRGR